MMVLAEKVPTHGNWYAGLGVGFAVVAAVVVLVAAILMYAARIADQALDGIERMDEARITTLPIWKLQETNTSVTGLWKGAESARRLLGEMG